jgi:hypothetical protein
VFLQHTTEDRGLDIEAFQRVVEFILTFDKIERDQGTRAPIHTENNARVTLTMEEARATDSSGVSPHISSSMLQVSIDSSTPRTPSLPPHPASRPRQTAGTNFFSKGSGEERGGATVAGGPQAGLGGRQYSPARMAIPGLQLAKAAYVSPRTSVLARYSLSLSCYYIIFVSYIVVYETPLTSLV